MNEKSVKREVSVEIDKLTNSIVNVISGEVFETEFQKASKKEIKRSDWLFDWHAELRDKNKEVYKMTTVQNKNIIQGLLSYQIDDSFVFVNLVESARFNRGDDKLYEGVGGNLFAFACKISKDMGFGGFVSFISKTALITHYCKTLGAYAAFGQRMIIVDEAAEILINKYFKNK